MTATINEMLHDEVASIPPQRHNADVLRNVYKAFQTNCEGRAGRVDGSFSTGMEISALIISSVNGSRAYHLFTDEERNAVDAAYVACLRVNNEILRPPETQTTKLYDKIINSTPF